MRNLIVINHFHHFGENASVHEQQNLIQISSSFHIQLCSEVLPATVKEMKIMTK